MPVSDVQTILRVYLVSLLLQLISLPLTKKLFGRLPDVGYPLSRLITTLMAALVIWETANLGLPVNTNTGLWMTTLGLVGVNIWLMIKGGGLRSLMVSRETLKVVVVEEYLFIVGLFGIAIVRSFLPQIDSLEKFMDFGFVNQYLLSPTLPAADMWQAGKTINYYSFGHYWGSVVIRYFGTSPTVGYNLVLAFIAGLSLSLAFSVSFILSGAKKHATGMIGGLVGAFATVMAGNTHVVWYLLSHRGLSDYWYADATRFIHNTIHEFPGYSFVVADLHGHLIDLPIVLAFILIVLHWLSSKRLLDEIMMGVLFGVMMMTNTWDVAVYGLLMIIMGLMMVLGEPTNLIRLIKAAGVMLLFMVLTSLPWFLSFQSISNGIKMVQERSPLWQLAVLWSGGLIISLIAVLSEKRGRLRLPIWSLAVCVVLLIIIPELVYAKDIYPDHARANTMFKLTYQASIMIGLLTGGVLGKLFDPENKLAWWWRWPSILIAGAIFVGTMVFPTVAFPNFYGNFKTYSGLDGEKWLKTSMPDRYAVISYLRSNQDNRNMVEAVGDSYTFFNAISVFSGVPTIQGWRVHEWLWRGGYETVSLREADVRSIYEEPDIRKVRILLKKYNVGWIVVGDDERGMYKVNEEILLSLGKKVFKSGDTYLLKVTP
ncbi:hypothetical protein A3K29_01370 [Candidatus Collierbacteria bacterium RIFOXYB2_FULL_46_14]|uniref:YYY membrane protein n=1 Tax=Candidatus Collierbacteria bacterium GW2011_GWA2_46_26 TaxID=1618381 RepID=A0A0G1SHK7_9BACT|nr:MAG: YYY membrane protein [Candidatus Collierbacteria bacterium GW2011_GWC2_44_13]KKU32800.1 MAG: YYY membrane protein [Candidatus Collierbacteria bacterium GW2011_GWA2_46_26]OGD72779.1 MAG: hypothetical protein A3K29_01370 [Candidatus Collierbacteria bacterium RIFOXYB2_FULL_46_14]OGD75821.1 MAG: hypothetical protein A3K43_01370 [Candidatus Collierbacteria bacterium RIFOXYA2_FULL_46_20]OGD77157.1 MAG: hypothetical protein A3K39_01370 [Candidatus Collierbacteria bacterium RIFOXYC2_FULL_43_15]